METTSEKSIRMKEFWAKRREEKEAHRLEIKKAVAEKEAKAEVVPPPTASPMNDVQPTFDDPHETPTIATAPVVEEPVKKATTAPWRPAKRLDIPERFKDPRFVYRFVNTKKDGNEIRKLDEGWEYDKQLSEKLKASGLAPIRSLDDGTPLDSAYRIRELIVMRMPKEMAAQRNKYYQDRANIDTKEMRERMRGNIGTHGGSQDAGVYADSFGLRGVNKEEREEIFRR